MKHVSRTWLICAAVTVVAWTGVAARAGAGDWQGQKLPIPTNFIMGYGSLINSPSRNSTINSGPDNSTARPPAPAIPVRVLASFGYIRSWNARREGFTALGLRKAKPGEAGVTINGVLYPVSDAELAKNDLRENIYIKLELRMSQIEAVGWQRLPETGHLWIYVPKDSGAQGGQGVADEGSLEPNAEHPLLQSYIDLVVEGGEEYGSDFAREILETTDGWSRFWLNDRAFARRPQGTVNPEAAKVDVLLKSASTTKSLISSRAFPEIYGERLRAGSAK